MAKRKKKTRSHSISDNVKQVVGVILFLAALLILIALISHNNLDDRRILGEVDKHLDPLDIQYRNQAGLLGAYLAFASSILLGWLAYFIPVAFIILSVRLFSRDISRRLRFTALLTFVVALLGTMLFNIHILVERTLYAEKNCIGGYIGEQSSILALKLLGELGSYVVLSGIILLIILLRTSLSLSDAARMKVPGLKISKTLYEKVGVLLRSFFSFSWMTGLLSRNENKEEETDEGDESTGKDKDEFTSVLDEAINDMEQAEEDEQEEESSQPAKKYTRKVTLKTAKPLQVKSMEYTYPTLDLLQDNPHSGASVSEEELKFTSRMLKETLETFSIGIEGPIEYFPGPVITRYDFKPASGVKVNQIINLSDDLALALKAKRIRIIAPIPGKAAVGIEIPNKQTQFVYAKDILASKQFANADIRLPLALGKTTFGKPYVVDLTKMPHLLVAGATGSGKSVCMNILITSLLYRLHPQQVRFILIDPKMLELSVYSGIPHLGRPVITNPKRAERVLADAVVEMESRYRKLANASVRNIEDFNKKQDSPEKQLPYIVILVDELADLLMSTNSSKTELLITRLAQMARAVGIHLVLATQRPSVDVITGLIKANFPARIAFQVSSKVDSRTILDTNGAERLLGAGDMLFLHPGHPEPTRLHGAYVTSEETDRIVSFIKDQGLPMLALENISQATGETTETEIDFGDPLFKEACDVVVRHRQGSVSLLQRRLGIGYQRAARLIDKLEQAGIVSAFDGSKAREVLVDQAYIDTLFQTAGTAPSEHKPN